MWSARRRHRDDVLAELELPAVTNIRDLRDEVSRRVRREVLLMPRVQEASICGACLVTEDSISVFYDPRTIVLHQDHIIAHEFAHLLLKHHETRPSSALAPAFFPEVEGHTVQMMLGRTSYEEAEERATERLAFLLQSRIINHLKRTDEPSGDEVQDRVARTLLRRRETR
ncbi:hypothetical protein [Streptomyces sp. NPDC051561]|uniref:hypothetical protein n=1 Tax=Streptomyces sp. NPDC051561 TaxID=3365658 RepID=UPI0037B076E2